VIINLGNRQEATNSFCGIKFLQLFSCFQAPSPILKYLENQVTRITDVLFFCLKRKKCFAFAGWSRQCTSETRLKGWQFQIVKNVSIQFC